MVNRSTSFIADIKGKKARTCEFHDEDSEIKTQIIHKTSDARLRKKALREQLDLKSVLNYGKTLEKSDQSARKLEIAENRQHNESTNHLESKKRQSNQNRRRHNNQNNQNKGNYNSKYNPKSQHFSITKQC